MLKLFNEKWDAVPYVFLDVETTGVLPGVDGVVQVAAVRFEAGKEVARLTSLIHPGRSIPEAATAIHGITDDLVAPKPSIGSFCTFDGFRQIIHGAQPAAYNANFDRAFLPLHVWGDDWGWPWADPLTFVRDVDRYERGAGRHKLEAACGRRGIAVEKAHDAGSDAAAAGRLFFRVVAAREWQRFMSWLSTQPPREEARQ